VLGIILRLLFGISQPREHALRCSPGHLARGIEAPHGITGFFKFPQDFGQQLRFSAIIAIVRSSVALAVYPECRVFEIRSLIRGSCYRLVRSVGQPL